MRASKNSRLTTSRYSASKPLRYPAAEIKQRCQLAPITEKRHGKYFLKKDFPWRFLCCCEPAWSTQSSRVFIYTILISLSLGSCAGYAIARYSFAGREQINVALLIVRMFPTVGISIPMAVILIRMGLYDTMIGLALLYSIPNIALTAWITSSIFIGISSELEEASLVFGANRLQTFLHITLPMAFPAMAASSMYAFLAAWNDTISALILTNDNQTLALVVYKAIGTTSSGIQYAAAGSIVLILPALVFTFIIRKYIGQMWGGVQL